MSGSDKRPIGRRIAGPVVLLMLVTFFAALISNEVIIAKLQDADVTAAIVAHQYFGLRGFEYLCDLTCLASLTWLGTYHLFMGRWRLISGIAMILGLLMSIGYGWHVLSSRNMGLQMQDVTASFPKIDMKKYRAELAEDTSTPIEQRSAMSLKMAKGQYYSTGEPQLFLDTDGTLKPYVPTNDEIRERSQYVQSMKSIQIMTPRLLVVGLAFITCGCLAFGAGIGCARAERTAASRG